MRFSGTLDTALKGILQEENHCRDGTTPRLENPDSVFELRIAFRGATDFATQQRFVHVRDAESPEERSWGADHRAALPADVSFGIRRVILGWAVEFSGRVVEQIEPRRTIDGGKAQPYNRCVIYLFGCLEIRRVPAPMKRIALVALFLASAFASVAQGQTSQTSAIVPVHVTSGTVLTFYLHARLNATSGDSLGGLPKGTLLRVKMLDSIDSAVNADGTEFHGTVVSGLTSSGELVIHPDSEVRGILALLRSRSHPEGFRYELLITGLTDHGKSYALTASLTPSLADSAVASNAKTPTKDNTKASESGTTH